MSDVAVNQPNADTDDVLASIRKLVAQNAAASEQRALVLTADHRVSERPVGPATPPPSVVNVVKSMVSAPDVTEGADEAPVVLENPVVPINMLGMISSDAAATSDINGQTEPTVANFVATDADVSDPDPVLDPSKMDVQAPDEPILQRSADDDTVDDTDTDLQPASETVPFAPIPSVPPVLKGPVSPVTIKSLETNIEEIAVEEAQTAILEESLQAVDAEMAEEGEWVPDNAYAADEVGGEVIEDVAETIEQDDAFLSAVERVEIRKLVVETIRDELRGDLGEKITRNVRKLVHREIQKALKTAEM